MAKQIYNPLIPNSKDKTVGEWLPKAIVVFVRAFMIIGSIALIFYLVWGGVMWITSGGDSKRAEAAGKQISGAIIGMIILFSAWAIIKVVGIVVGLDILGSGFIIPTL
ncbi:MAG: hypothetical protein BWY24_00284 [Microgenomates group bacterium ADurb.Bin219]|nr:MAG: hypothetical protein BWY24_00284 [Microgenomates group bacterium ADurb.Bin219]HNP89404.1 hypothetical protein [Candidatus Woesebacteria bacterium]